MTQPTVSKSLKEVVFLRIGFNPTRSTSPCYKPTHIYIQHTVIHNTKIIIENPACTGCTGMKGTNVFRRRLKQSVLIAGSRIISKIDFQTVGPETWYCEQTMVGKLTGDI